MTRFQFESYFQHQTYTASRPPSFEAVEIFASQRRQHLSFAIEEHYCAGNMLAGLQLRIAIAVFVGTFARMELVETPTYPRVNQAASIK